MSVVSLVIQAKDQASQTVQRIGNAFGNLGSRGSGQVKGLSSSLQQASDHAGSLVNQITRGVVQANLLSDAFGMVTNVISQGLGVVGDGFAKSAELQLSNLTTASGLAAQTGLEFDKASQFVDSLNTRLAVSAASLPGNTAGYSSLSRSITDNLIPAFKGLDGSMDMKGLEDNLASISETYGALSAGKGIDTSYASMSISKALGGGSLSEMYQGMFMEQSPELQNYFEQRLAELGAESFGDIDIKQRVQIIKEAGEKFITNEFKDQATQSVNGLMEGFKSALFDPMTGLFGLSVDLDQSLQGEQSAFKSLNAVIAEIIGPSGLFFEAAATLKAMGVNLPHPMQLLKSGLDIVLGGLKRVNQFLGQIQEFMGAGGTVEQMFRLLPSWLGGLNPSGLGETIGGAIEGLIPTLGVWFHQALDFVLPLLSKASQSLVGLLQGIDFGAIGKQITDGAVGLFWMVGGVIQRWMDTMVPALSALLNQGVQSFLGFIRGVNWQELGVAAGVMTGRILGGVVEFLGSLDYVAILMAIGEGALAVIKFVTSFIGGVALGMLPGIGKALGNIGQGIAEAFSTLFLAIYQTVKDVIGGIANLVGSVLNGIVGTISRIPGVGPALQSAMGMIQTIQSAVSAPAAATATPSSPVASAPAVAAANLATGGGRWNGNIPTAAKGLLAAASEEQRNMPSGAQIVVANDREFILKPTGRGAAGGGSHTFNITIQGISDPAAIADEVIRQIQARFEAEIESQLA